MDIRKIISDALVAFSAQGVRLLLNVLTALFVPKVLGVAEYGYWQFFLLVISYVGICHCGINDGVYLLCGGKSRESIDKASLKSQFIVSLALEIFLAISGIVVSIFVIHERERIFCFILSSLYMILINATYFWGFIFQATDETKIFSYSSILERAVFLVLICLLLLFDVRSFEPYVLATVLSMMVQLVCCLYFAGSYFASDFIPVVEAIKLAYRSMTIGIKLTVANIASTLILGFGRIIIDFRWGIEAFGELSFSLSLVTFFLALVSQASMVLFPSIKKCTETELKRLVERLRDLMEMVLPFAYLMFFPTAVALQFWLPEYESSLTYLPLLLPICVFESKADILCYTVFKARREEAALLRLNIKILLVSIFSALCMGLVFDSVYGVIASMVFSITLRSCLAEIKVSQMLNLVRSTVWIQELILTIFFVVTVSVFGRGLGSFFIYSFAYVAYIFLNKNRVWQLLRSLRTSLTALR